MECILAMFILSLIGVRVQFSNFKTVTFPELSLLPVPDHRPFKQERLYEIRVKCDHRKRKHYF